MCECCSGDHHAEKISNMINSMNLKEIDAAIEALKHGMNQLYKEDREKMSLSAVPLTVLEELRHFKGHYQ